MRVIKLGALVAAIAVVALAAVAFLIWSSARTSTVGDLQFRNELRIPPLADTRTDGEGRKVFDLELQRGMSELLPGKQTETWGANGSHLAPTLRASRGEQVMPHVVNGLDEETTTIHWHGMHLPAAADGGPHQTIAPGQTWSPAWTIDQPAATLWYHSHPHAETEDHVYRGLVRMFIVDDPETTAPAISGDYGVDDIPLIIQDKKLEGDGSLHFSKGPISPTGLLGDKVLVNGTYDPHLDLRAERLRLRLLNASGARIYNIGFDDDREFELIAMTAGCSKRPSGCGGSSFRRASARRLSPSSSPRAGRAAQLRARPGTNFWDGRFAGSDDSFDLLKIRAADELALGPEVPDRLVAPESLADNEAVETRRFELSGQGSINGRSMD